MKKDTNISYSEFEKEIVTSEYQRTRIMMGAFTLGFFITVVNYFLLNEMIVQYYGGAFNYFIVVVWLAIFVVYEIFIACVIKKYMRARVRINNKLKITHSLVEVTLISLLIFYMVGLKKICIYLDSPLKLLYYLFLVLSVLHLDFKASLLTGVFGAVQYSFITWYSFHITGTKDHFIANIPENSYHLDSVVLVVCGMAAGFVADQVKRRVKVYLEVHNAKNEMELLFGQQVSRKVMQTLVEDKGSLMRQEATVLAMDIRNFSAFAGQHSPHEIMDFQNKIFGPILDIIDQYDGMLNQIMGDGLMATFGILGANANHADMAYQAALKIREKVKELSQQGIIPPTRIGLGIDTGEVVTGNIGNETRKQYSISGPAVIIAFRLEQLNKEFGSELLITGEVKGRIAKTNCRLSYLGLKSIKGFEYEVDVYQAA